jgi:hypothetical protein
MMRSEEEIRNRLNEMRVELEEQSMHALLSRNEKTMLVVTAQIAMLRWILCDDRLMTQQEIDLKTRQEYEKRQREIPGVI